MERTVGPLEALLVGQNGPGGVVMILVEADPVDVLSIQETKRFWLLMHGPIPPISFANYLPNMSTAHDHKFVLCDGSAYGAMEPVEVCLRCGKGKPELDLS